MAIKGGFRPSGEKLWPRDKPRTGQAVEFKFDGRWYPGTYDDSEDWPAPVWETSDGAVLPGAKAVGCHVAKCWRERAGLH